MFLMSNSVSVGVGAGLVEEGFKELAKRWNPAALKGFEKRNTHQALDDIRESLAELAGKGDEFFEALRQIMNLAFELHESHPKASLPAPSYLRSSSDLSRRCTHHVR